VTGGVLLIGAGGLGCGAALALGEAGVGRLGVADDDRVDESNLHRQVLHRPERVGTGKARSLAAELATRFPDTEVVVHEERFTADSATRLLAAYDVLLDGSDNLATKFLANDAAVLAGKPLVHGAAVGFDGQLLTVPAGGRPCYRCLFEELPPPEADAPSCVEAGVLGPVPGVIGALQASEAVRLLAGQAPAFAGRLLRYQARGMSLQAVTFRPNPACRVCGPQADIRALAAERYDAEACQA
jgi:molybdopterin/thiamine biosynthesis adenylyltransferase